MNSEKTKLLTKLALMTAIALIIHIVEAQIPNPIPIPGVKLGLANIVTVYCVFTVGAMPALWVLVVRIFLGSIFAGNMMAFFYSLAGGILCFASIVIIKHFISNTQIWVSSVIGAVFHNLGQILVAIFVTGTLEIAAYFPILMVSGILAGLFTGIAAQTLIAKLPQEQK